MLSYTESSERRRSELTLFSGYQGRAPSGYNPTQSLHPSINERPQEEDEVDRSAAAAAVSKIKRKWFSSGAPSFYSPLRYWTATDLIDLFIFVALCRA